MYTKTNWRFALVGAVALCSSAVLHAQDVAVVKVDELRATRVLLIGADATQTVVVHEPGTDLRTLLLPYTGAVRIEPFHRRMIGVVTRPLPPVARALVELPADQGLHVAAVTEGFPAAIAGVQVHDVILTAGGAPVDQNAELVRVLETAGDRPTILTIRRGSELLDLSVSPLLVDFVVRPAPTSSVSIRLDDDLDLNDRDVVVVDGDDDVAELRRRVEQLQASQLQLQKALNELLERTAPE